MALVIIISKASGKVCGVNIVSPWRSAPPAKAATLSAGHECPWNLLTANSGHKELQEAVGVDIHADFRVRLHLVGAFDYVTVSVQDIALDISAPVADGFAARKLTARLDVHMHVLGLDQSRINGNRDGRGVVHGSAGLTELHRQPHQVFQDRGDKVVNRTVRLAEFVEILRREHSLIAHLKSDP